MPEEHLKSDEDVEAILQLAVRRQGTGSDDLRRRLEASAAELGISPEALEQAEAEYNAKMAAEAELEATKRATQDQRRKNLRVLAGEAIGFVSVNLFLHALNFMVSPHTYWACWPLLGTGIGFFSHLAHAITGTEEQDKRQRRRDRRVTIGVHIPSSSSSDEDSDARKTLRSGILSAADEIKVEAQKLRQKL